ncbi:AtuA-related protein [Polaromonas sp. LjRoot131]|uniref:AtuA-related protein n=1 Tax=Polaromonas sp. LjRoot131 TaxID=3342262 RepID=UPI003ECE199B
MSESHITVPLYRAAHGRTGDKGNRSNISVIAWHPDLYPVLLAQLTEAAVAQRFAHRQPTRVQRFELPGLAALNFVLDEVLDGGVNDALNLDTHGKALSFWLLDLPIAIPAALAPLLAGPALTHTDWFFN